eukprot:s1408_g12.t1
MCENFELKGHADPMLIRFGEGDVVNPKATSAADFWQLRLTATALQSARAAQNAETRVAPFEQTPLLAAKRNGHGVPSLEELKVCMRFAKDGSIYQLPSANSSIQASLWQFLVWTLRLLQVLMPAFYFVVNKPCAHPDDASAASKY